MAGFVAFKAGAFTSSEKNSSNFSPPDSLDKDSIVRVDPRIGSSKYMILSEEETLQKTNKDTTINLDDLIIPSSKSGPVFDIDDMPFMGSSKSDRMFDLDDTNLLRLDPPIDSLKDSLKATKKYPNSNMNANGHSKGHSKGK